MAEIIKARLEKVIFTNPANAYAVGLFRDIEQKNTFTAAGRMEDPQLDQVYQLEGDYTTHPRFGRQFHIDHCSKVMPSQTDAIIRFLASSQFPGIGQKTAATIVDTLGDDCLEQIASDISVLNTVPGMNARKMQSIQQGIQEFSGTTREYAKLLEYGLAPWQANMLLDHYENTVLPILEEDPFAPLYEVYGFGYRTAVKLADAMEVPRTDLRRLDARLYDLIRTMAMRTGNTWLTFAQIWQQLGAIQPDLFEDSLQRLQDKGCLTIQEQKVYPFDLCQQEHDIARELCLRVEDTQGPDKEDIDQKITQAETALNIQYDPEQKTAIHEFFNHAATILNGGPGTGKTTTVKGILETARRFFPGSKIQLAAPTGRAAKRLAQLSDNDARTIHSLLKWDLESNTFGKNEKDPLDCDILILDECSMIDTNLFASLLKALPAGCRLLMIGDENQLESVGPGKVFQDLIESGQIPTTRLHKIFRQSEGSGIITLAGEIRQETDCTYSDGVIFQQKEGRAIIDTIKEELLAMQQRGEDLSPFASLQVLAPMYKGPAGIDAANEMMQSILNPPAPTKKEFKCGPVIFREEDKVMLLKNDPDHDVYNGDIGSIAAIDPKEHIITVDFGHSIVDFSHDHLSTLSHAWCVSVHKAQGSEYQKVWCIVSAANPFMLNQKLLYTAVSRAKKELILLGDKAQFEQKVRLRQRNVRQTTLQQRIHDYFATPDFS